LRKCLHSTHHNTVHYYCCFEGPEPFSRVLYYSTVRIVVTFAVQHTGKVALKEFTAHTMSYQYSTYAELRLAGNYYLSENIYLSVRLLTGKLLHKNSEESAVVCCVSRAVCSTVDYSILRRCCTVYSTVMCCL